MQHADIKIKKGQLWRAARNPYPLKGHDLCCPWSIGSVYRIDGYNDMGGRHMPLVAFKSPDDPNPLGGWEIREDNFRLGFELVVETAPGQA